MTVKDLKNLLEFIEDDMEIVIANDEELNNIYKLIQIAQLVDYDEKGEMVKLNKMVLYPVSNSLEEN